jgi:hypothetical protein
MVRYGQMFMYFSMLCALEKLDTSTTKAHLQMKTRQQHSDERPIKLTRAKAQNIFFCKRLVTLI